MTALKTIENKMPVEWIHEYLREEVRKHTVRKRRNKIEKVRSRKARFA